MYIAHIFTCTICMLYIYVLKCTNIRIMYFKCVCTNINCENALRIRGVVKKTFADMSRNHRPSHLPKKLGSISSKKVCFLLRLPS